MTLANGYTSKIKKAASSTTRSRLRFLNGANSSKNSNPTVMPEEVRKTWAEELAKIETTLNTHETVETKHIPKLIRFAEGLILSENNIKGALYIYDEILKLESTNSRALYYSAYIMFNFSDQKDEALKRCNNLLAQESQHNKAILLKKEIETKAGALAEAKRSAKRFCFC